MRVSRRGHLRPQRPALLVTIAVVVGALVALAFPAVASAAGTTTFSATQTIPVPPASTYAGSGGGDGWAIALSSDAVYNVFHHSSQLTVACHLQSDASPCWTPETITETTGAGFATSGHPGLWLDQSTGKLYAYATRADGAGGVVCIDTTIAATNSDPFCGFTGLTAADPAALGGGISPLSEPAQIGSKWYAFNYVSGVPAGGPGTGENTLLCFDLSTKAACPSQPYAVAFGADPLSVGTYPEPQVASIGGLVVVTAAGGTGGLLSCFDPALGRTCSGSWPISAGAYPSSYGAPFPLLSATGAVTGFCLPDGTDECFGLTGAPVPTPAGMAAAIPATSGWNGQAVVLGPRVYVPDGNGNAVDCFDANTGASCANFPKVLSNLSLLYTVNPDPQRPTCLWVNADNGSGQLQNFDAYTGGACGQGPIRVLASSFVVPTALCQPASYTSLQVTDPAPGTYSSGTVAFEDGDAQPLPGLPDRPLDASGTADLSGLNLSTAVGLPQFLITLTGAQGTPGAVTVKLTWTGTNDPSCVEPGTTVGSTSTPSKTTGNWAGFVGQGNSVSLAASGQAVVPTVTCNVAGRIALWVGLDGYDPSTSNTVEQDGVSAICDRAGGAPRYELWYELFKGRYRQVLGLTIFGSNIYSQPADARLSQQIRPGDAVDMFVTAIAPDRLHGAPLGRDQVLFTLSVNRSNGNGTWRTLGRWSKSLQVPYAFSPKYNSNECILETPTTSSGLLSLPKFTPTVFNNCSAIDSGFPLTKLDIARGGHPLTATGDYTRNVNQMNTFTVTWKASQ